MRLASQGEIAERRTLETLYGSPFLPLILLLMLLLLLLMLLLVMLLLLLPILNSTGMSQQEEEMWGSRGFDVNRPKSGSSFKAPF